MWIMLSFFLSLSSWALEPYELIKNVKILRVLDGNIVMVDRGLEDGLSKNDHAKFSQEVDGFSSRAICVKASATTSYWKLYRIPNSGAFSQDFTYVIAGLADREIPWPQAAIRDEDVKLPEEKKDRPDPGKNPFEVKRDLPEKLTERDLLETTSPEQRKLFMERTLNRDQLRRDLRQYKLSFYASPFSRQSINEGESLRYGIRGGNVASRYRLLTQLEQQQTRLKDPITEKTVSTRSTSGQAQFVIHRLTTNISSLSLLNYNSTRFGVFATPKNHWQFGPLGFTWHLYESKTWEYMDLSYIPLYDLRETEVPTPVTGSTSIDKTTGIRHGFRFAVRNRVNERVSFENMLWVKPFQKSGGFEIEGDNLNLSNDLKLIFNISNNFFFDYNFIYQKDKLWRTLNGLPEDNVINAINFRYDVDV